MREVALKRVAHVSYGLGQPPELTTDGVPILRATNVERGSINPVGLIFSTADRLPLDRAPLLHEGEILVVRSGAYTGDSALITSEWAGSAPGYDLRVTPIAVQPRFLAYELLSRRALDQIEIAKSRAAQPHLNADELGEIRLWCPSARMQRAVVDYLDCETARIDALIEKKRTMQRLLNDRQVTLTDSRIEKASGEQRPVAALASYVNGWAFKPEDFTVTGLPVVRIKQLVDREAACDFYDGRVPRDVVIDDGDLIFSWSGSLEARIWDRGPAILNQHLFRVIPHPAVDKGWLRYALDHATRRFAGLMHGSAMTHITKPMMKQISLPVPARDVQEHVARELDREWGLLQTLGDRLERQIVLLREHRQALITAAVTGELEIPGVAA